MPESKPKNFVVSIEVVDEWCKGCDICVAFCPKDVLELRDGKAVVKDVEMCTACGICEMLCPDFAIQVVKERLRVKAEDHDGR